MTLGPAQVTEEVTVVGQSADTLTKTAQIATNFSQDLIRELPTSRDLNSILLMAPGVHPTGPAGAFSFGGSVTFENLFLLNGVSINENIRGQAFDTAIEDAIQETTVANGGVSAEFGRFSGGVVNIITKSGGNQFSGSFRNSLNNDKWRTLTPFETERLATTPGAAVDKVVPTYEYTLGGPIMRDRLWFFTSGRLRDESQGRTLIATNVPYEFTRRAAPLRGQGHVLADPEHRFQVNYNRHDRSQVNYSFNQNLTMDLRSLGTRKLPERLYAASYSGTITVEAVRRGAAVEAHARVHRLGREVHRLDRRHAAHRQQPRRHAVVVRHVLRRLHARGTRQRRHLRQGLLLPVDAAIRLAQPRVRLRQLQRHPPRRTTTSRAATTASSAPAPSSPATAPARTISSRSSSATAPRPSSGTRFSQESEGSNFRTHSGFVNDTWRAERPPDGQRRRPLRQESRHRSVRQRRRQGQRMEPAARHHLGSDRQGRLERHGQRREVRGGDLQPGRRFVGGRRQSADPACSSIAGEHQRAGHDDAGADRAGDPLGVRLVLRERRTEASR